MGQLESPRWVERQRALRPGDSDWSVSFPAFREAFEKHKAAGRRLSSEVALNVLDRGVLMVVIYGDGGWNRYAVRGDGSIEFLVMQSRTRECTARARELGFTLFP
jgi:hypothetical protein